MALKIIGAGFGRTGTLSLYTALNELGYPCYHMFEVIENKANKGHLDFWRNVGNSPAGMRHDWEKVFAKYTASVDNPAACVWQELMVAYPDAKVILSLHPKGPEVWYQSTIETIYSTETMWQFKIIKIFTPFGRKMGDMTRKLIWQRAHKGTMSDRTKAIEFYQQHIERVKREVPADRLLVFSVDQGWEPLCRFLGVAVPAKSFPNVNDREQIKKSLANMTKGAYVIMGGLVIVFAAALYGLSRLV
jgi:hypothetical protein